MRSLFSESECYLSHWQDAFLFVEAKWKPHLSIPCYSGFAPCQTPMLIDEKTLADQLTIIEMEIYKKIMPPYVN